MRKEKMLLKSEEKKNMWCVRERDAYARIKQYDHGVHLLNFLYFCLGERENGVKYECNSIK